MATLEAKRVEKALKDLLKLPANKRCADCSGSGSLAPQYVCVNFSTFVCTNCATVHRGLNHRVKGVSMSTFSAEEVAKLAENGNEANRARYQAGYQGALPDHDDPARVKAFLHACYVEMRFMGGSAPGGVTPYGAPSPPQHAPQHAPAHETAGLQSWGAPPAQSASGWAYDLFGMAGPSHPSAAPPPLPPHPHHGHRAPVPPPPAFVPTPQDPFAASSSLFDAAPPLPPSATPVAPPPPPAAPKELPSDLFSMEQAPAAPAAVPFGGGAASNPFAALGAASATPAYAAPPPAVAGGWGAPAASAGWPAPEAPPVPQQGWGAPAAAGWPDAAAQGWGAPAPQPASAWPGQPAAQPAWPGAQQATAPGWGAPAPPQQQGWPAPQQAAQGWGAPAASYGDAGFAAPAPTHSGPPAPDPFAGLAAFK